MKIQLNTKLKRILSIFGGIVVIIVGMLYCVGLILYFINSNTEEKIGFLIYPLAMGLMFCMYKIPKALRDKQRVMWSSYPELNRVFWGLSFASYIYICFVIVNIIDYAFDLRLYGIPDINFDFIFSAIFSLVTFIAVANASKYTTILTRGFFINQILLYSLLFFLSDTIDSSEFWFVIPFIAGVISVCVKGLIITYGKSWKEQFKTQKSPFIIILLIIFLSMSVVFLRNTEIHKKSTSTFPPLEQTK